MYGMETVTFAKDWNESVEEAQKTVDKVMSAMPGVAKSIDTVHQFCNKFGYIRTLGGNMRRLPNATQRVDDHKYREAQRQGYNAVVQGSGPLITNSSIIIIRNWLERNHYKSRIVITVHDSILLDIHPDEIKQVLGFAIHTMENLPLDALKCKYSDFGIDKNEVPEKYIIDDEYFRFPMFAEAEIGKTYAQELDYNEDEIYSYGTVHNYCDIYSKTQEINDYYSTKLMSTDNEDEKEKILADKQKAMDKWEQWKDSQRVKKLN